MCLFWEKVFSEDGEYGSTKLKGNGITNIFS